MTAIVFAGPSIFGFAPEEFAGLEVRSPAARGDLLAAAFERPEQIVLIDGIFENAPSVWHKEILFALAAGIIVSGAASMGALRAAECAAFGMVGVGAIFEDYRSGRRSADADVAVVHAPAELGYRPLTEALVDVEATLRALRATDLISATELSRLGLTAANIHFSSRSWPTILVGSELPETRLNELRQLLKTAKRSQKQADARLLLAMVREGKIARPPNTVAPARLSRTPFLENLKDEIRARQAKER